MIILPRLERLPLGGGEALVDPTLRVLQPILHLYPKKNFERGSKDPFIKLTP